MTTRMLIVNPFASGVDEHRLAAVRAALPSGTETMLTTSAGEGTEIARSAGGAEAIYVFGGDGTFNEVLNGVETDVPLGFIPGGGTSVLPRALGLPRNPGKAAQRIAEGRTRRIGLGRVNGRRFGFSAGLGLDAELVRKVDELGRRPDGRRPGDVAFMKVASGTLWASHGRFDERLEIESAGRAAFVLVANCSPYTYAGALGLDLVPGASFDDGLAYVAPVSLRARDLPRLLARGARGSGLKDERTLAARDLDRIVVKCDEPLPLQVDGEDTGDVVEAIYEAERDAVTVFV
ncbi:MAG TPA: diacylglycerol kinase family protein [Gaiellaceae bacterium]|nr:diacylglycerol kinase family protein [Gaiellaceae bacterium]